MGCPHMRPGSGGWVDGGEPVVAGPCLHVHVYNICIYMYMDMYILISYMTYDNMVQHSSTSDGNDNNQNHILIF